jgi:hypothetical protein
MKSLTINNFLKSKSCNLLIVFIVVCMIIYIYNQYRVIEHAGSKGGIEITDEKTRKHVTFPPPDNSKTNPMPFYDSYIIKNNLPHSIYIFRHTDKGNTNSLIKIEKQQSKKMNVISQFKQKLKIYEVFELLTDMDGDRILSKTNDHKHYYLIYRGSHSVPPKKLGHCKGWSTRGKCLPTEVPSYNDVMKFGAAYKDGRTASSLAYQSRLSSSRNIEEKNIWQHYHSWGTQEYQNRVGDPRYRFGQGEYDNLIQNPVSH